MLINEGMREAVNVMEEHSGKGLEFHTKQLK
jgi:hypothetical protein